MADSQQAIPRLVEADAYTRLFTATHATLSLPAPLPHIDSIAAIPGLGEHSRVTLAIDAWEAHPNLRHFLVGGTNKLEVEQPQLTLERLQHEPYTLQRTEGVLTQVTAEHTRVQTDWIIEQVVRHDIRSLAVCTVHWHIPRAYRALVKSMQDANVRIPIFPITVGSSPRAEVPELHASVEELSVGEAHRILKYEENGQIIAFDQLMEYLDWLWSQPIVPISPASQKRAEADLTTF